MAGAQQNSWYIRWRVASHSDARRQQASLCQKARTSILEKQSSDFANEALCGSQTISNTIVSARSTWLFCRNTAIVRCAHKTNAIYVSMSLQLATYLGCILRDEDVSLYEDLKRIRFAKGLYGKMKIVIRASTPVTHRAFQINRGLHNWPGLDLVCPGRASETLQQWNYTLRASVETR